MTDPHDRNRIDQLEESFLLFLILMTGEAEDATERLAALCEQMKERVLAR